MKKAAVIIPALALLLFGAHGLRQGDYGFAAALAMMAGLVLTRRPWACLAAVAALLWAGWTWADAAVDLIRFRQAFDLPWTRLAFIMGAIVILNGVALWILASRVGREFSHGRAGQAVPRVAVMVLVCVGARRGQGRGFVPDPVGGSLSSRLGRAGDIYPGPLRPVDIRAYGRPRRASEVPAPYLGIVLRRVFFCNSSSVCSAWTACS